MVLGIHSRLLFLVSGIVRPWDMDVLQHVQTYANTIKVLIIHLYFLNVVVSAMLGPFKAAEQAKDVQPTLYIIRVCERFQIATFS